ncbi:MAG: glucose 1-dehydrogenase [Planctomycetes bacterium]|nr:glucose 1-dehydrogenase [Planctomycetota bacterium]
MKLRGKVAVITGGSKGIGFGCARVFAKHGATVVIGARGEQAGREAERQLTDAGHRALFVRTDVTQPDDIRRLIDTAVEHFGRLDSIVNNAGWHPPDMTIDETSLEDFESLIRLNLTSTFLGAKYAVPHLRKTRGTIINISSAVAKVGQAKSVSYVTTKAGQIGLTRALAVDLAPEGIRVNAVCPGAVRTPLLEEWARAKGEDVAAAMSEYDRAHPRGSMATIDEIGEVCAFLASDEASFLTGQAIYVDGGVLLG